MTSSNGNIFRVRPTGHLRWEFTGPWWIPRTKASDAELWCFFDLRLNKRLSKQSWGWWFETLSRPLWRHCNGPPVWSLHWSLTIGYAWAHLGPGPQGASSLVNNKGNPLLKPHELLHWGPHGGRRSRYKIIFTVHAIIGHWNFVYVCEITQHSLGLILLVVVQQNKTKLFSLNWDVFLFFFIQAMVN